MPKTARALVIAAVAAVVCTAAAPLAQADERAAAPLATGIGWDVSTPVDPIATGIGWDVSTPVDPTPTGIGWD